MSKLLIATLGILSTLLLGCVSESSIVDNAVPGQKQTDFKEAARTRMSLGLNYLQRGENAQAIYNLEKAKELAPDLPEVSNALAYYYQRVGENEQAEKAYRDALRRDSNHADTYNNFGAFLCQIGKYAEAEKLLLSAVNKPGYLRVGDSYENLAFCALAKEDFLQYKQYLRQSLQHNGNKPSSLYNIAVLEYAMGNQMEAQKWQNRLQQIGQVSPAVTLLRYMLAYRAGNIAEQQNAEKFLLSVYPESPEASMVVAKDFEQSDAEKLRARYKKTLIGTDAEIDDPSNDQPQVKIVKRKSLVAPADQVKRPPAPIPAEIFTPVTAAAKPAAEQISSMQQLIPLPAEQIKSAAATPSNLSEQQAMQAFAADDSGTQTTTTRFATAMGSADSNALTHKVLYGETLYSIANRYHLSVAKLQQYNQLNDASRIQADQVLQLTAPDVIAPGYQVQAGDTLDSIAAKFKLSTLELSNWNQLAIDAELSAGQTLTITAPASQ